MVIGAFPAAKLGALLLRQVSKPIANMLIARAKSSPFFRTYICMPPAQFYNWCEVKTKMWILNLGKPVNVPVLNEAMAIELGSNLLGEGILFAVAAVLLLAEYNRSSRKEAAKEAAKQAEMESLNTELQELFFQMEEQRVQIKELYRYVYDLESQAIKKPSWGKGSEPKEPPPPSPPPVETGSPRRPFYERPSVPVTPAPADGSINKSTTLLLKAVQIIENDYFINPNQQRELGVLPIALNHVYQGVLKVPFSMY